MLRQIQRKSEARTVVRDGAVDRPRREPNPERIDADARTALGDRVRRDGGSHSSLVGFLALIVAACTVAASGNIQQLRGWTQ